MIVAPCEASETGTRKIFGLFSLIERIDLVVWFIQSPQRFHDCELPFRREELPLGNKKGNQPCKYEFLRSELKRFEIEALLTNQRQFLVPVFGREPPWKELPNDTVFPFVGGEVLRTSNYHNGQSSTVKKVALHPAHYVGGKQKVSICSSQSCLERGGSHLSFQRNSTVNTFTAAGKSVSGTRGTPLCAIKQLQPCAHYPKACEKEIRNLMRFRDIDQDYLVELLFAYTHNELYHLVFPWADGNLRTFWKDRYPDANMPKRDESLAKWVFQQSYRLIQGLRLIHGSEAQSRLGDTELAVHGTHGDLKPENILWFEGPCEPGQPPGLGKFQISDFGGSQFHTALSKSRGNWGDLQITETYQAPETGTSETVAQSYDIWSLGCVLSEFVTWHLQGWKGVDDFSKSRAGDRDPHVPRSAVQDDDFFLLRYRELREKTWNSFNAYRHWLEDQFFHRWTQETEQQFLARFKCSVKTVSFPPRGTCHMSRASAKQNRSTSTSFTSIRIAPNSLQTC